MGLRIASNICQKGATDKIEISHPFYPIILGRSFLSLLGLYLSFSWSLLKVLEKPNDCLKWFASCSKNVEKVFHQSVQTTSRISALFSYFDF